MKEKKTILVTWDFTEVSDNAFLHALKIARSVDNTIRLVHIVKADEESVLKEVKEKLKAKTEELTKFHNIPVESVLLKGTIFSEISKYASDNKDVVMVVMGTHGIKGKQKYFGSAALKVIIGSTIPFVVVQNPPEEKEHFSDVVFPIDFKSENKEKLFWAIYMGKYLNAKIHLFKSPVTDKSLSKKVKVNLNFAIRFLIQNNIDYEIHTSVKSGNFAKEVMSFSREIKADMIIITTTKHITFLDYIFGAPEQYIMANASRIPVMVVNPKANFANMGQFMFGR
ncbi:MAG: universal stress protein [Bacteroidales bacterium]|nr:universal stress protein [Bacteroidales bacterium]MCF8389600.1 universal stress protein [Bacteroidales bacterium]